MAELPDLDKSSISFVAFWNAIDQGGVTSIDPEETTSNANMVSYTLYDNGLTGVYDAPHLSRDISFRVKSDGWMVAYIDRRESFGKDQGSKSNIEGPWGVVQWSDIHGNSDSVQNTLERAIYDLHLEFSNSDSMSYASADVGLYNYEYDTATTLSHLSSRVSGGGNRGSYNYDESAGFTYSSSTDILWHVATSCGDGGTDDDSGYQHSRCDFEGTELFDTADASWSGSYGALDLIATGLAPNSGTEYTFLLEAGSGDDFSTGTVKGSVHASMLSLWK